ncbi:MAG: c-type cytochrome [Gemmataceae bacterium]
MAASDQHYRSQRILDIVFAVSCVLMLVSILWMMYDDYTREFKTVQRKFRDVETGLAERQMLTSLPDDSKIQEIEELNQKIKETRSELENSKKKIQKQLDALMSEKGQLVVKQLGVKADLDSESSLYNIAVDENGRDSDPARQRNANVERLTSEYGAITEKVDAKQAQIDQLLYESGVKEKTDELAKQEDSLKKLTNEFDRLAKTTVQKEWKFGDWFRSLPILDAFAPPTKIQQVTLKELTIDYGGFSNVIRYDRCTTCHLGIDRANYDRASLKSLGDAPDELKERLAKVKAFLANRKKEGETLTFDPDQIPDKVRTTPLTPGQVTQFCAHPRLGLFVDPNSKHPVEQFGCTICHAGQGSATDFDKADHMPATTSQQKEWTDAYHWERERDWDFPMLSSRFVESSCVKCHYQMTDLVTKGSREEAPKLLKGYNLFKENGCFGCHEVAGIKSGREIGPDVRLEPIPPLDALTAEEQVKLKADPLNPPGAMRKVGPSLYRLSEKTNQDWARKWIMSPRGFRPDTKMPHFYGLSTNSPDVLPDDQKNFPNAEIHSIAHYLFQTSEEYLQGKDPFRVLGETRKKELEEKKNNNTISDKEKTELVEITRRLELTTPPTPLDKQIIDENGQSVALPPEPADGNAKDQRLDKGRQLFTERGCLACHSNQGTEKAKAGIPAVVSNQHFGPNLSRLAPKIAPEKGGNEAKRRWIVQWLLDPTVHSPRTRMPNAHFTVEQADQVGAWLLSQPVEEDEAYEAWKKELDAPDLPTLRELARVYLAKAPNMTKRDVDAILGKPHEGEGKGLTEEQIKDLLIKPDADEYQLKGELNESKLAWYIGKKSIGRLGCYACHNIPGFEIAKPVGTALNDWGKKDPLRLAFEDIVRFVRDKHNIVEARDDSEDKSKPAESWHNDKNGKTPYEAYFFEGLENQRRDGFLHQKLAEPRSFDYGRLRTWDDRLRMPQFKFANSKRLEDEADEAFAARALKDESEAREAVMTFVLGLVAEPLPLRYVSKPAGDRLAEVKGREVLEKYNCAGCHQLRPGVFEYKLSDDGQRLLAQSFDKAASALATDHFFSDSNAWMPLAQPVAGHLLITGTNPRVSEGEEEKPSIKLRLAQALRAPTIKRNDDTDQDEKKTVDIPAGTDVQLQKEDIVSQSRTWGGTFADMLVDYVIALDPNSDKRALREGKPIESDVSTARSWLPPPLAREGERVQPGWLFNFLRNPQPIRPASKMMLRMPRFNMSEEEAMMLVNYFAAVDRLENPGIGLTAPYVTVAQQDERYWQEQTRSYVARLGKEKLAQRAAKMKDVWKVQEEQEKALLDLRIKTAKEAKNLAKTDADKARFDKEVAELNEKSKNIRKDIEKRWEDREVYANDAYHLLANASKSFCLECHRAGNALAKEEKGPPLELSFERLRPEWTVQWLANPRRLFTYDPIMPQNFPKGQDVLPELFEGDSRQKVTALRDVLMNLPKVADMPANRNYYQSTLGGK